MAEYYRFLGKRGHITIPHEIRKDFDMRHGGIFHVIPLPQENRIVLQRAEINDFCPMKCRKSPLRSLYQKIDKLDEFRRVDVIMYLVGGSTKESVKIQKSKDRLLTSLFRQIDKLSGEDRVELLLYLMGGDTDA